MKVLNIQLAPPRGGILKTQITTPARSGDNLSMFLYLRVRIKNKKRKKEKGRKEKDCSSTLKMFIKIFSLKINLKKTTKLSLKKSAQKLYKYSKQSEPLRHLHCPHTQNSVTTHTKDLHQISQWLTCGKYHNHQQNFELRGIHVLDPNHGNSNCKFGMSV